MMILSQDGMVAVNSDNVAMFEVKETETIPHEAQLMATIFISGGGRYTNAERTCCPIGTFRSPDRTELAKLALDYISFSISSGHKGSAQVPTEDEMRNIQGAKSRADAARRGKLDDIIKELLKEDRLRFHGAGRERATDSGPGKLARSCQVGEGQGIEVYHRR